MKLFDDIFAQKFVSEPDALKFDNSNLFIAQTLAFEIINSSSPVPNSYSPSPTPTRSAGFKPPRIEIPKWSGKSYEFYTWITACPRSFEITQCPEYLRAKHMLSSISSLFMNQSKNSLKIYLQRSRTWNPSLIDL